MPVNKKKVQEIKERYEQEWLAIKEVVAIGIGKAGNEMGIIISVSESPEKLRKEIPGRIDGVPIKIRQTGRFKAQ